MTIAIGFKYPFGMMFCADTKITTDVQTQQQKLFPLKHPNGCVTVFAMSGNVAYACAAIGHCQRAVSSLDANQISIDSVRRTIEAEITAYYQMHIYPHPDRPYGQIDFNFLIGVWLNLESQMFVTQETAVNPVELYECIGGGAYLARYWLRQFFNSGSPARIIGAKDVGLIAASALYSVRRYDNSCGGDSQFIVLKHTGEISRAWN